tara:strand:+ start:1172 stop:2968 length:1797 start_codon:yes stop_codon:yes gene_type:complete
MFKLIKNLFSLLTSDQRKRFYYLQGLVLMMSIMEIFGVASIIPFMALVGDMDQLRQDTLIAKIYEYSGITSELEFIFLLGIGVLFMLVISSALSMFTIWRLLMFANKIGMEIADRLYSHYLKQDWLFHASGSSAQLTKKIATEIQRIIGGILMPLMHMNAKIVFSFLMSLSVFIYDPKVAIIGLSIFALAYFFLFKVVRMRLYRNGLAVSEVNEKRFSLMNEGFGGIKDILLLGRDANLIKNFYESGVKFAYSNGNNAALAQIPRYLMELVAFGSMISLVLYLIAGHSGNLGVILPILSVYALASIKLLPALQLIYTSFATIRANIAAFESIKDDLMNSSSTNDLILTPEKNRIIPKQKISLKNISFNYPGKEELTLNKLNLLIEANSLIGIVGPSGSGKSTLIDILLGLIEPNEGHLKIDEVIIDNHNRRSWQNSIGFVAQSIFLSEGTIAENVAFGVPKEQIKLNQVEQALELAHLLEFARNLEHGIHSRVGERGVQLSGGQRQRIGIARALYHKAEVLIFDEATSSLDGITEKLIMEAIHDFSGKKTIILIAHRLKTIEKCDNIFFIDNGQIVDEGRYKDLIERNKRFQNMAEHA